MAQKHPLKFGGFLSVFTQYWVLHVINGKNWKNNLEKYALPEEYASKSVHKNLKKILNKNKKETGNISLGMSLVRVHMKAIVKCCFFRFIAVLLRLTIPFTLEKIVHDMNHSVTWFTYFLGFLIACLTLLDSLIVKYAAILLMYAGIVSRSCLSCFIIEKTLKMDYQTFQHLTSGHILSTVSTDVEKIYIFSIYSTSLFSSFTYTLGVVVTFGFCYDPYSAMVYLCINIFIIAAQTVISFKQGSFRLKIAEKTDKRVLFMNEILSGINTIKMLVWEKYFIKRINILRQNEIFTILSSYIYRIPNRIFAVIGVRISTLLLLVVMKSLEHENLPLSSYVKLLLLLSYAESDVYVFLPLSIYTLTEARKSLYRIQQILDAPEIMNIDNTSTENLSVMNRNKLFKLIDINTEWMCNDKSDIPKKALRNLTINCPKANLIGIHGRVGSGKSTLLLTILRELPITSGYISASKAISYAPQEAWLFNGTIRENIMFHEVYNREKYINVLKVTCLEKDISEWINGDQTLVGERGLMLSGGQKARISLARAIYRDADLYLLDDPLSALDKKIGKDVMTKCIKGYLKDKVTILVTHQVQFLKLADNVFELEDGSCKEIPAQAMENLLEETPTPRPNETSCDKQLIDPEDSGKGFAGFKIYYSYFKNGSLLLIILFIILFILIFVLTVFIDLSLSNFSKQDLKLSAIYGVIIMIALITLLEIIRQWIYLINVSLCSINLHNNMFKKIMTIPMRFFNTNPKGRILNRFSRDMGFVDSYIIDLLDQIIYYFGIIIFTTILATINVYFVIIPLVIFAVILVYSFLKLSPISSELKRFEAISRTPIYEQLDSILNGIVTIRSFKKQQLFMNKFYKACDSHTNVCLVLETFAKFSQQCYTFIVTSFILSVVTVCLYLSSSFNPVISALVFTYLYSTVEAFQFTVKLWSDFDIVMTSVERINHYSSLSSEGKIVESDKVVPASWPKSGRIVFKNLSLRYDENLPLVLKTMNIDIKSGEKIGVVGRTGAGKSSLISALFQLTTVQGQILIDDIDIVNNMELQRSRSAISVIPQDPTLFSGSYRTNLDPFDNYTDDEMWMCLDKVQLSKKVSDLKYQLDSKVTEGGKNLSVGEKQLFCLARALLRKSHILVIDEATANVDNKTDRIIQKILKNHFKTCTMITIAHRLDTIKNYDRIMVLGDGKIVECGSLSELLGKKGFFYKLVNS